MNKHLLKELLEARRALNTAERNLAEALKRAGSDTPLGRGINRYIDSISFSAIELEQSILDSMDAALNPDKVV